MKLYKNITDSKIDWLGEVPNEWKVVKLKYALADVPYPIVDGPFGTQLKADEYTDSGVPLVRISNLDFKGNLTLEDIKFISEQKALEIQRSRIKLNDIIIGKTGATIGKSGLNDKIEYGIVSSSCLKISVDENKLLPHFFKYYVTSANFQNIILQTASGSTRDTINITPMANLEVVIPTKEEQTKIALFLDTQTATIDQLIQQKEKLIELLKEKRQAVINEAVTKGLNQNEKMKDSGLEWLGEVPKQWNLVQIRHLNKKVGSGVTPKGGAEVYTEEGVIFIRSQNVHFDGLRLDDVVKIDFDIHEKMSGSKVKYKDVLLNITGASIGRCCVVEIKDEMNVNQHVCIIRPTPKILPEYLNLVLQSNVGQVQIKLGTTGGNREGLTFEAIKEFVIPLPDLKEQEEILNAIQSSLNRYYELESLNSIQIDKMKEYRQSIISEAVTGKIDVRDWQPVKEQVT
jgi:type I restriction enzyme S subunit